MTPAPPPAVKRTEPRRQGRDRFQAFGIPCARPSEAPALLARLGSECGLTEASHLIWALRTSEGGRLEEAKSDGGESGAGNCILEVMRRRGTLGRLVLVARWYGGRHLGALRFRIIRELAAEASGE